MQKMWRKKNKNQETWSLQTVELKRTGSIENLWRKCSLIPCKKRGKLAEEGWRSAAWRKTGRRGFATCWERKIWDEKEVVKTRRDSIYQIYIPKTSPRQPKALTNYRLAFITVEILYIIQTLHPHVQQLPSLSQYSTVPHQLTGCLPITKTDTITLASQTNFNWFRRRPTMVDTMGIYVIS